MQSCVKMAVAVFLLGKSCACCLVAWQATLASVVQWHLKLYHSVVWCMAYYKLVS